MIKNKKFFIAEAVFVVGVFVYFFFSTAPSQIYPLSGMTIIDSDLVFEIEHGEEVIMSFDEDFTNPIILNESSEITLSPGTYFWKVKKGFRESEVQNFTIQGHVSLDIEESALQNSGNVDLNVTKKKKGRITRITLDVGESEEVENNTEYEGEQI